MNKWQSDLVEFHKKFDLEINDRPDIPTKETVKLRYELIKEETNETLKALDGGDLIELADGIVDSIYVLLGTAVSFGINVNQVWTEVHKTNMAKVGGNVREDGKILKPEGWKPPRIREILISQGMEVAKCTCGSRLVIPTDAAFYPPCPLHKEQYESTNK